MNMKKTREETRVTSAQLANVKRVLYGNYGRFSNYFTRSQYIKSVGHYVAGLVAEVDNVCIFMPEAPADILQDFKVCECW